MAWGAAAEGDDEGDDESDEEKAPDVDGEDAVKNDHDTISRAKTVAMVEMEVEGLQQNYTKDIANYSRIDKKLTLPLPRAEGQLSVPIFPKSLKLSPIILRYNKWDYLLNLSY